MMRNAIVLLCLGACLASPIVRKAGIKAE